MAEKLDYEQQLKWFSTLNYFKNMTEVECCEHSNEIGFSLSNCDVSQLNLVQCQSAQITKTDYQCKSCGSENTYYCVETADQVCECGIARHVPELVYLYGAQTFDEMDHYKSVKVNKYCRITNLKTILRNLQAYPSPLPNIVKIFVNQNRGKYLSFENLRLLMKKFSLGKFYSKIHLIMNLVNPFYKPCRISKENYCKIVNDFSEIMELLMETCKGFRKNSLNYFFLIELICRKHLIFGLEEHLLKLRCKSTKLKQLNIIKKINYFENKLLF